MNTKWKCYVCGKPLESQFRLISMMEETDRVFLVHSLCSEQLDDADEAFIVSVTTTEEVV